MAKVAAGGDVVQIDGLREFVAALKEAPDRLDKQMRAAFREIAADVRTAARANASEQHPESRPNSHRQHKQHWSALSSAITSGADSDTPWVKLGSAKVPWALGYEFGSQRHRQFPAWRGSGTGAGYFFWPAIREKQGEVNEKMLEAVDAAFDAAYPD